MRASARAKVRVMLRPLACRALLAFAAFTFFAVELPSAHGAPQAHPASTAAPSERAVVPTIDGARIKANITELASDAMNGRAFKSDDGRRAAAWVADKLQLAGALPLPGAHLDADPA